MTKTELRKTAQTSLKAEYGFAPSIKDITLLEASGDGTYILFSVCGKEYRYELGYGVEKTGFTYETR